MLSSADIDSLRDRAARVHPRAVMTKILKVLADFLLLFPFILGWSAGAAWRFAVFICLTVRYGYWKGARIETKPKERKP